MVNIDGVVLDGNGSTVKIDDNDFDKSIKNLEIKNFTFDGNGLNQLNYKNGSEIDNVQFSSPKSPFTSLYMPGK